ncbi:MAG: response regulator [Candidatus Cloacimonetes bacterium]|jgi:two-component system chemotaxis response regulator CheY|nr:response regulator [Candidatus Cloacimonadota bacterium]MDD4156894.1 response regulator [Candidatus Cloacimonadota bacterium]
MKLLTVDDSRMIRMIIINTIKSMGFETLEAPNADVALEILETESENINLILLDWNMPGMNGFELLKIIKTTDKYKHIPVMMVTTEGERKNVIKAIQTGAENYLTKPFTPEDLSSKILECLGLADNYMLSQEDDELPSLDMDDLDL